MGAELPVGSPITVIWRQPEPGSLPGVLQRLDDVAVVVDMAGAAPWPPGQEVLLVAGELGHRMVAKAAFAGPDGEGVAFTVTRPFLPFDARGQTRYPLSARTEVRSVLGQSRTPGQVLDISLGGLAVEVTTRPGGKTVEVPLQYSGYSATLPCEVVGVNENGPRPVLHLKFLPLTAPQQAFVRFVLAGLESQYERLPKAS
ncbi:MAG: PilZ domain-containing protein [Hyphomicrobiales bacterium]